MSGDPTPERHHAVDARARRRGRGLGQARGRASDRGFRKVVASEDVATTAADDHAVKVARGRPEPRERVLLPLRDADAHSDVGRFRTAPPPDSKETDTFAFFSCQEYTAATTTPRRRWPSRMSTSWSTSATTSTPTSSTRSRATAATASPCAPTRSCRPRTLKQYRDKYKLYRSDKNLRKMQAAHAMVTTWDDHEVTDDYAGAQPEADPAERGYAEAGRTTPTVPSSSRCRCSRPTGARSCSACRVRPQRRPARARRAPVPRRAALRRPVGRQPRPVLAAVLLQPQRPAHDARRREGGFLDARLAASNARWKVIANEVPITPIQLVQAFVGPDDWAG